MTRDALSAIRPHETPQTRPLPGRTDQVRNNAGGYVWPKDAWTRLRDWMILGTTGGTYYLGEQQYTQINADFLLAALAEDAERVVSLAREVTEGRPPLAPRPRQAIFSVAAALAGTDPAGRQAARSAFADVVRTTDHFAMAFGYGKQVGGKKTDRGTAPVTGRCLRSTYASWFAGQHADRLARRCLKGLQRKTPAGEAFALRDALRIAHPSSVRPQVRTLFGWLAGNVDDAAARETVREIDLYLTAKAVGHGAQAVSIIREGRTPWEYLPSEQLRSPEVWSALAGTIGCGALIRNLARMTRCGALTPFSETVKVVQQRLTDPAELAAARIHPADAWLALKVYASGCSQPNPKSPVLTWTPVPGVTDALEECAELSFGHVHPSGKRLLIAVDSSGSMARGSVHLGISVLGQAYQVASALATILMRLEPDAHVIDVDTSVHASRITRRSRISEAWSHPASGGGTNLALPFAWAMSELRMPVDGIIVITDAETWAGASHASQALAAYRQRVNPNVRVIVVAMTASGYQLLEPGDSGVLNVAGLDASLPQLVTGYLS
jgi:60 kDa SS-A/Ro ribonucleoprotein